MLANFSVRLFCLLMFLLLSFSSCKKENAGEKLPDFDAPQLEWVDRPALDAVFYTDEQVVLQAKRTNTDAPLDKVEWKVNGVLVTSAEELISDEANTLFTLTKVFPQEGTYDVSVSATNAAGTNTLLHTLTVLERPIPKEILLAGSSSKKWKFFSVKLLDSQGNLSDEQIADYEKDNTLTFYRTNQSSSTGTYNCIFDAGTNKGGQSTNNGTWEFSGDSYIRFTGIDIFPSSARIDELSENKLTLSKLIGNSRLVYYLEFVE